jgi:hydrogenase maturation protein HypF
MGRLFDAVSAIAGLGRYNSFEAQLPMALEAAITDGFEQAYDFQITNDKTHLLDIRPMLKQIVTDVKNEIPVGNISAKFHNTLVAGLLAMAQKARQTTGLSKVALSGGVFCNRYLTNRLIRQLKQNDFTVLFNHFVPSNDGGISLGQAAIAMKKAAK